MAKSASSASPASATMRNGGPRSARMPDRTVGWSSAITTVCAPSPESDMTGRPGAPGRWQDDAHVGPVAAGRGEHDMAAHPLDATADALRHADPFGDGQRVGAGAVVLDAQEESAARFVEVRADGRVTSP